MTLDTEKPFLLLKMYILHTDAHKQPRQHRSGHCTVCTQAQEDGEAGKHMTESPKQEGVGHKIECDAYRSC